MTEADIEGAAKVQAEAFGGALTEGIERYKVGPRYTWRDGWVVEVDGEIRAAGIAIPATWWFRGVSYPISAVAGVAVRDVDRRRGYASALMRSILQADLAAGRPYSALYPFQHGGAASRRGGSGRYRQPVQAVAARGCRRPRTQ
jgi:predicted acetyltransferase